MLGSIQSQKYTKTSEEENVAFSIQRLKPKLESCSTTFSESPKDLNSQSPIFKMSPTHSNACRS